MKEKMLSNKMRYIAAGVYTLIFIYQLFLYRNLLSSLQYLFSIATLPFVIFIELAVAVGGAIVATKLIAHEGEVHSKQVKTLALATFFIIIFELFTYTIQTELIGINFQTSTMLQVFATNKMAQYIAIVVRLMLLIIAVFFVSSAQKPSQEELVIEEVEETEEIEAEALEALAEEVLTELDKEDKVEEEKETKEDK